MMRPFSARRAAVPALSSPSHLVIPGIDPSLLERLGEAAAGGRLALVGGAVRDLLLHRVHNDPWRGLPDLDLVVEPPAGTALVEPPMAAAHRLARRLRERLGPAVVRTYQEHGAYGTVELELDLEQGPVLLDLASARGEHYPLAGENPRVSFGTLADDLARRDYTINAMALLLGGPDQGGDGFSGRLLDPHGGQADLQLRRLQLLHRRSLRDDPTRILRGARYAARLGFHLAPESLTQLRATLAEWPWNWRPGDPPGQAPPALGTRLRMELELLLERENWAVALEALQGWGALTLLDTSLQDDRHWRRRLRRAGRLGLPRMAALLAAAADPLALANRLQVPHRQHQLLSQFLSLRQRLEAAGCTAAGARRWPAWRWCAVLEAPGGSPEAVALALAAATGPRRPLLRWWLRWRHLRGAISAEQLMAEGVRPGPALGERLRQLRVERLDRERI
jgi:poly(A) polymerase